MATSRVSPAPSCIKPHSSVKALDPVGRYLPRRESRYPLASFCSRNEAASIVLNRLLVVCQDTGGPVCGSVAGVIGIPLLDLIVPVVRLLHVACGCQSGGLSATGAGAGSLRTRLHHHRRRRAVDILLEAYIPSAPPIHQQQPPPSAHEPAHDILAVLSFPRSGVVQVKSSSAH